MYRYLKKDLSDLIYNNKEIDEVFGTSEELILTESESKPEFDFIRPVEEDKEEMLVNTIFYINDDSSSSTLDINQFKLNKSITSLK